MIIQLKQNKECLNELYKKFKKKPSELEQVSTIWPVSFCVNDLISVNIGIVGRKASDCQYPPISGQ